MIPIEWLGPSEKILLPELNIFICSLFPIVKAESAARTNPFAFNIPTSAVMTLPRFLYKPVFQKRFLSSIIAFPVPFLKTLRTLS
jgi:hypothetical protein